MTTYPHRVIYLGPHEQPRWMRFECTKCHTHFAVHVSESLGFRPPASCPVFIAGEPT